MLTDSERTTRPAHLEVRWHKMSPTAMSWRPPFFFLHGRRRAPQRWGMTTDGTLPEQSEFMTLVRDRRALLALSGEGQKMECFKRLARKHEGP